MIQQTLPTDPSLYIQTSSFLSQMDNKNAYPTMVLTCILYKYVTYIT